MKLEQSFTEYLIEKSWISNLSTALTGFGVIYSVIFIVFVLFINFDLYRFRIMFNYVNMHVNTSVILIHLLQLWLLIIVVIIVVTNINVTLPGVNSSIMSEETKAYLKYRLELSTMIIWIFILIFVFIL